jgi:predicted RNase H-like HicB family nuclease
MMSNGSGTLTVQKLRYSWNASLRPQYFTVYMTPDDDGGFVCQCKEIPGALSEGDNLDEALTNIMEAIALILKDQGGNGPFTIRCLFKANEER